MSTSATDVAQELSHRGYAVVRGFLSDADVSPQLITHLNTVEMFADRTINNIPASEMQGIREKIAAFMPDVTDALGIEVSSNTYGYCAIRVRATNEPPRLITPFRPDSDPKTSPGGIQNWHIDHFSYYIHPDHVNRLICYMPIAKSSPTLANLAILPTDVLQTIAPELYERIQGRGAIRFRQVEADTTEWFRLRFPHQDIHVDDWFAIDDYDDATPGWKLDFDLEQYKVVPQLEEKDLLIMKADVIHRTNDAGITAFPSVAMPYREARKCCTRPSAS